MFPMLEPCGPWCCGSSLKELFGWFFVGGSECQLKRKWLQILQFIGSLRFYGTTKIVPGQLHSETAWFAEDKSLLDQERPRDRWPLRFALHEILCKRDPQTLQAVILTCVAWFPRLFCSKAGSFEPIQNAPKYWPFWYPGVFFKSHLFGTWQFSRFGVAGSRTWWSVKKCHPGDWPETLMVFFQKKICLRHSEVETIVSKSQI